MIAFVTGATGFLGKRVVTRLLERGDSVRALVRDESKARDLADAGAENATRVAATTLRGTPSRVANSLAVAIRKADETSTTATAINILTMASGVLCPSTCPLPWAADLPELLAMRTDQIR